MKIKLLIWISLATQFCFLFFILFFVPEQISTIKNGLQVLKETCPASSPISQNDTGFVKLINAGDYFLAACGGIKFLTVMTLFFVVINICLLVFIIFSLGKEKRCFSK